MARIMSDLLENSEVITVEIEFYSCVAETIDKPVITQPVSVPAKNNKGLVVDEVADTSKGLDRVREHLKEQGAAEVRTATIYYKPCSARPDWFERKTKHWPVFHGNSEKQ